MTEESKTPTTVKELGIHIGYLREDLAELKTLIKEVRDETVGRIEFEEHKKTVFEKMLEIEQQIVDRFAQVNKQRWIQNTLSAILGVLLTLLTTYAFTDLIK